MIDKIWAPISAPTPEYGEVYRDIDSIDSVIIESALKSKSHFLQDLYRSGYSTIAFDRSDLDFSCLCFDRQIASELSNIELDLMLNLISNSRIVCTLLKQISRYLVLDAVDVIRTSSYENAGSDFWHRDGVGNRLKVFIPLNMVGSVPPTQVFPSSHTFSVWPRNWELLRCGQKNSYDDPISTRIEERLSIIYGPYRSIEWHLDKLIVLNTNAVHRAGSFSSSTYIAGTRYFLSLEIMNPDSSYLCSFYKLGRVGTSGNSMLFQRLKMLFC
jgi:hypothetical protein